MAIRIGRQEALEAALSDLLALASNTRTVHIERAGPNDVEVGISGEQLQRRRVRAYDTVDIGRARALIQEDAAPGVVVANRITRGAAQLLSASRWSWMDRRGEAHIDGEGRDRTILFLDAALAASSASQTFTVGPAGPVRGKAGLAYAIALLLDPAAMPSMRSVAREVDMSPQSISDAARHLREAGLVSQTGEPAVPELFWAVASIWRPLQVVAVATVPRWGDGPFTDEAGGDAGWVLAGDQAAIALGAPLFAVEPQPTLWAPDLASFRRGVRWCEPAGLRPTAAALALPPTLLACTRRTWPDDGDFPLPHPLFAALDLAVDPGRGREILSQWTEPEASRAWI